ACNRCYLLFPYTTHFRSGLEKKIWRQGFCYNCFFEIPQAAEWIINPELSRAHLGIEDRDLEYEKKVQLQPHIVYLANSSSVKVGDRKSTRLNSSHVSSSY